MLRRLGVQVWRWLPEWTRGALTWCFTTHFVVGTVAIIEDREGRVLLARLTYRRHAPWALTGGWVRRRDDPSDTIVREILVETGLTVEVLRLLTVQRESPRHLTVVYAACHHAARGISSGSNSAAVMRRITKALRPPRGFPTERTPAAQR